MTLEHHVTSLTTAFKLSPRCSVGCRMLQEWCMLPGWRLIGMRWGLVWCFGVLNLSPHMELEGRLRSSGGRREEMGAVTGEWDGARAGPPSCSQVRILTLSKRSCRWPWGPVCPIVSCALPKPLEIEEETARLQLLLWKSQHLVPAWKWQSSVSSKPE